MATIDLSQLPAPDVVEALDYETFLAGRKATLVSLYPADQQDAIARTLAPEAEPIRTAAEAKLAAFVSAQARLGRDIRKSALHVEGV